MALALANVELSDSFNTWRLRTNSVIGQSASAVGTSNISANVTITGLTTISANVTISGLSTFSASATFSSNTTFNDNVLFTNPTVHTANITSSGTITASDFNSLSDAKYKTDVHPIDDALSIVSKLEGKHFVWKNTGKPSLGFIAQEVEEVLPQLINTQDNGSKTINYSVLVAVLVEAIKQQQKQIDELKS
jgi:hypothetical protein